VPAPAELYCVIPSTGDLPAGAYVYDAAHHSLVAVRHGDAGAAVVAAVGPAASGAALTLVLSTVYWRTAFMYRNYAYRLVTQEAGLVAGNAMLVAGAFGLRGRLHHRFDQAAIEGVLDVGWPDESVLSVVTLHPPGGAVDVRPAVSRPGACDGRVPDPDRPTVDPLLCAHLLDLDAAARAEPAHG
jgi:SagB-type dehydrogenase family enzyme